MGPFVCAAAAVLCGAYSYPVEPLSSPSDFSSLAPRAPMRQFCLALRRRLRYRSGAPRPRRPGAAHALVYRPTPWSQRHALPGLLRGVAKPHWSLTSSVVGTSSHQAWAYLLSLFSFNGLSLRRFILNLQVVAPFDGVVGYSLQGGLAVPTPHAVAILFASWLVPTTAPLRGASQAPHPRAFFWDKFHRLCSLLPVTYRVIFISLSRRVRKIVRNRFRFRKQFVCVPPHARLVQGFRLLKLCLRFVEGRTWPARLRSLLGSLFTDQGSSPVLYMRARQQVHVLSVLRRQYLFV